MKYMLIMRATDEAKAAYAETSMDEIVTRMGRFNEAMIEAGVLLSGDGLADDVESTGFVVDYSTEPPTVTDGAYGPTQSLFNGFWMIAVESKEAARDWALRCPLVPGNRLEVRRVTDASDFAEVADNEYLQKEAGWRDELGRAR